MHWIFIEHLDRVYWNLLMKNALSYDLRLIGLKVLQQFPMPFIYKDVKQEIGYRLDLLVNDKLIIEIKSVDTVAPVHFAQALTYLN